MKLHSRPASPYSARVRIAIYAKNLPVEIVTVPMGWPNSPEFLKLNPLGRIPVLEFDDGTTLAESAVIVEYLEDAYPDPPLRPRSARDLARVRFVTQAAEQYVVPAIWPLFGMFDTKIRDEAAINAHLEKLHQAVSKVEALLPRGRYVFGDRLTTADAWMTPVTFALHGLMGFSGRMDLLDAHPAIRAYVEMAQRDPVLGRVWSEMDEGVRQFLASREPARKSG